ncbi:MAG: hypothetical protein Q7J64_02035 [Elusimicrobiota bacterium]|nr:hypothetical protein [Elusimicrobiota bacterium]
MKSLRKYDLQEALQETSILVAQMSRKEAWFKYSRLKKYVPAGINIWQQMFVAHTLIVSSNDFRPLKYDEDAIRYCANLFNDVEDPHLQENSGVSGAGFSFLLRLAHSQFPMQISPTDMLPRFAQILSQTEGERKEFDIDGEFQKISGLSIQDCMTIGFGVFSVLQDGQRLALPLSNHVDGLKDVFAADKIEKFIKFASADYKEFRDLQVEHSAPEGFERYQLNGFYDKPLIKTTRSRWIVAPIPIMVLFKSTIGIYYALLNAHEKSGKRNDFRSFFGKNNFERYVGWLLEGRPGLIKEITYGVEIRTSDWILIEGDTATLIECKLSGLTLNEKSTADSTVLEMFSTRVVKGVSTCNRTEADARSKKRGLEGRRPESCGNCRSLWLSS